MEAVTFKKLVKGHAYSVTATDEVSGTREVRRNPTYSTPAALIPPLLFEFRVNILTLFFLVVSMWQKSYDLIPVKPHPNIFFC